MWSVDLQKAVFQDKAVIQELTGAKRMAPVGMVHTLFAPPVRDERLIQCVNCLIQKMGDEDRYGTLRAFCKMVLIMRSQRGSSPQLDDVCQKAASSFNLTIPTPVKGDILYGRFECGDIPIAGFEAMAKNHALLDKMEELVTKHTILDPRLAKVACEQAQDPDAPLSYDNYAVKLQDQHELVLIAAPRKPNLKALYEMAIRKSVSSFITLCSPYENQRIAPFWLPECFTSVQIDGGWTITPGKTVEVYCSNTSAPVPQEARTKFPERDFRPKIVARHLVASRESETKEFVHLFYENWPDNQGAPDTKGLVELFRYQHEYVQKTKHKGPTVVNCHYGIGRTAIGALIDAALRRVTKELQAGKKLHEIVVNLPELHYEMRKTLPYLGGIDFGFGLIYKVLAELFGTSSPATEI